MVQIQRKGLQYADNLCNYVLSFNTSSNWTVSSGTGSADIEDTVCFEGSGSLSLNNNDVVNDITFTNTTHATTINRIGSYGIGFYLYKKEALQEITGKLTVFKNDVELSEEAFSIGSDDADLDINNSWVSFQSTADYNFAVDDVITFTITINGIPGSVLTTLGLFVDGFMIYNKERLQEVAPIYNPPIQQKNIFSDLEVCADESEAITSGLTQGEVYKTSTGELRIKL